MPRLVLDKPKKLRLVLDELPGLPKQVDPNKQLSYTESTIPPVGIPGISDPKDVTIRNTYRPPEQIRPTEISAWNPAIAERVKIRLSEAMKRSPFTEYGKRLGQLGVNYLSSAITGLGLYVPDIITKSISKYDTFTEAMNKITGFLPTPREKGAAKTTEYITGLTTAGKLVGPVIARIPARQALRTILNAGLNFGARSIAEETSKLITTKEPINWQKVHAEAGVGSLFGIAEAGLGRLVNTAEYKRWIKTYPAYKNIPRRLFAKTNEAIRAAQGGMSKNAWTKLYSKDVQSLLSRMRRVSKMPVPVPITGTAQKGLPTQPEAIAKPKLVLDRPVKAPSKPVAPITAKEGEIVAPEGAGKVEFDLSTVESRKDASIKVSARAKEIADKLGLDVTENDLFTTVAAGKYNRGTSHGDAGISMFLNKDATQEQIDRIIIHELGHTISPKKTKGLSDAREDEIRIRKFEEEQLAKLKEIEAPQPEAKQPTEKVKEIIDVEKETITEPPESPKVDTGKAGKLVPTGKLDPTNAEEALEIIRLHKGRGVEGIFETKWDKEKQSHVISSIEYTAKQVDQAYRTVQKPVESPMPDTDLFAMPGKEKQMKAIAEKMSKMKALAQKKKGPKELPKPAGLPKMKKKAEDQHKAEIKGVYGASLPAGEKSGYALDGVKVEGENIIATDGRRMFRAKGKWGKDGLYLDQAALKKGSLGKLAKDPGNFPRWQEIVPDVSKQKPIIVNDLATMLRHVRQASNMTSEESKGVLVIANKDGTLGFSAAAPEIGHAEINVQPGSKILGGANPRFLMDAVNFHATRGNQSIQFYFNKWDRPIMTRSLDGKTRTITMPINVGEPTEAIKKAIAPKGRAAKQGGFLSLPETPSPEAMREGAERIYQNAINRFASIENATKKAQKLGMEIKPGENPGLRARSYLGLGRKVESVLTDKTYRITPEGKIEITGEGLKPILDDYDKAGKAFEKNRARRKADLKTYLEAQRTILDLQRPIGEWTTQNIVSNAQVQKAKMDLERLKKKYGQKGIDNLETHAQRLYEYQKRVLHTLVDGGNLSQKQYNDILSKNKHYIPFDRVLGDEIGGGVPVSKGRFTKARAPVKRIKGSEREIQDPIESIIKNTFRIMEAADRNTVARNVAKLARKLPEDIRPVRVKMFPIRVDPKEILTISREFRTQSAKVMKEFRDTKTEGGKGADVSGPIKKLEKVVKESLTKRGYSEGEANSFIAQIRKGKKGAETPEMTTETIRQIIKETQNVIITKEPVESTIFRPSQFAPKGKVIEYFDKGKRKYIEVSPNLYDAMTGLNEQSSSLAVRILSLPAHWLRIGATSTPEFVIRNPIRDQWTALMQTSFGFVPFYDSMGAIADIMGQTTAYHDWLRSGGAYSGFVELNRPALKKAVKELTSTRSRRLLARLNPITDMQDLSQLMESATRVGIYKRAIKSGMTPIEAGFESREGTLDFQRRGASRGINAWNKMTAFFNVGIQAADKNVRTAYKNPVSSAIKGFLSITIPSILLTIHNMKDPAFKEVPRWRKDIFWTYMHNGFPIHIIKPFFWGQLYGSLPERLMEYLATKDPKAFRDFGETIFESFTPIGGKPEGNLLPTFGKPIIENWGNENFFLERPIVPEGKKDLKAPYQYSRYTSESAKYLGQWMNWSPAKIENLIRGYSGGTGRYGLQGTDALINAIKKAQGKPVAPKRPKELADYPLIRAFVGRSPTGPQAQSIQDFYKDSQKAISAYDTYNQIFGDILAKKQQLDMLDRIKRQRPLSTAEMIAYKPLTLQERREYAIAEKFERANPEILAGPFMKQVRTQLAKLSKQTDAIIKMDIPDREKRKRLAEIDSMRLRLAQQANRIMRGKKAM